MIYFYLNKQLLIILLIEACSNHLKLGSFWFIPPKIIENAYNENLENPTGNYDFSSSFGTD